MAEKSYSIRKRFAFIAAPAYLVVVALVTTALDQTFQSTALKGQRERLEAIVYSAIGSVVWRGKERNVDINEATFAVPGIFDPDSELALLILDDQGRRLWSSTGGELLPNIKLGSTPIGEWNFGEVASVMGESFFLQFAVDWIAPKEDIQKLHFVALQTQKEFLMERKGFRNTLWISVVLASLALALALYLLFDWGMRPLSRFERELAEVRAGDRQGIEKHYPVELYSLKDSVNLLLEKERRQTKRISNLLDDLAHSLKTPLTVLRSRFSDEEEKDDRYQVKRIGEAIDYYVKKARSSQRLAFQKPIAVQPILQRIKTALEKAHESEGLQVELDVDEAVQLPLSEQDVFEVFGNLMENAAKYGRSKIWVRSVEREDQIRLEVEDDGEGLDLSNREKLIERGFRSDESKEGSGIGLHLVSEIAQDYGMILELNNAEHGGARISLVIPKTS